MRHNELRLFETPNISFLGHPINAFHFVRHVASGWTNVRENVLADDTMSLKEDLGWWPGIIAANFLTNDEKF